MRTISIKRISITDLDTDAVVNAANEGLWAGSGVCGAIFKAAGHDQLEAACSKIGHCDTGSGVITPGFRLKAKYIVHAVGPRWFGGSRQERSLLYGAYQRSLELAADNGCHSIGFPLISAGIFGYPVDQAWKVAMEACRNFLDQGRDMDIVFAVLSEEMVRQGREVLKETAPQYRIASRNDWKNLDLPAQRDSFVLDRSFTPEQMSALRKGNIPQAMEDKWFWYMEGDTLYAHRSWTGNCIFVISFSSNNHHKVVVNRDPEQYSSTGVEEDRKTLNELLDYWTKTPYDHYHQWLSETAGMLKKK